MERGRETCLADFTNSHGERQADRHVTERKGWKPVYGA